MRALTLDDPNLHLNGLPWYQRNRRLWRLPLDIEPHISPDLWACSKQPSGARLRLASDTTALGISLSYHPLDDSAANNGRLARMGVDLYADGSFWTNFAPASDPEMEVTFFTNASRRLRQFTIYLPLGHHVEVRTLLLDDDAALQPPAPFALPRPVVFYGTSITQGGCASRPGLSYQAMLSRALNLDFVNLGFSGLGRGEIEIARAVAEIDAACYVLDFGQNNPTIEEFESVFAPFFREIRASRPDTPVIMTTPICYTAELRDEEFRAWQERRRDVVRTTYQAALAAGDANLHLVEGRELISPDDGDGQIDGAHPNDLGFAKMSRRMAAALHAALHLPR